MRLLIFFLVLSFSADAQRGLVSQSRYRENVASGTYPGPPEIVTYPVISGTATEGGSLSTTNGSWNFSPFLFTYQWKRNGSDIGGATASSYTVVHADLYQTIICTVTAANSQGTRNADSNSLYPTYTGSGTFYRTPITIINTGNAATLNDQINIQLTGANFNFNHAKSDGGDLRFFQSDGTTPLNYWVESYSYANSTASIWVKASGVSAFSTGTIYLNFGNSTFTTQSSQASTMALPTIGVENCIQDFTGKNTYSGLYDTWPTEGSIKVHITPSGTIGNKRIFCKYNIGLTDYIDCNISAQNKLQVSVVRGGTTNFIQDSFALTTGVEHCVVFTWDDHSFSLYLDNVRLNRRIFSTAFMPNSGSDGPFASGQLYRTSYVAGFDWSGTLIDGGAYNATKKLPQVQALGQRRNYYQKDEPSKWADLATYYSDGSPSTAEEPSLLYVAGTYWLYYTLGTGTGCAVWRNTSTDLVNWGTPVRVMGQGTNGESGFTARSIVFEDGGKYYMAYQATGLGGGPIKLAESTDGTTFTNNTQILAVNAMSTNVGWHNTGFVKMANGDWIMLVGGENSVTYAPYRYIGAVFKSTNGLYGPYSAVGTNPKTSQQFTTNYLYGPSFATRIGSVIYAWDHQGTLTPLLNECYALTSSDNGDTWSHRYTQPIDGLDRGVEVDQVADPYICYDGTQLIKVTDMLHNTAPFTSYVGISTFSGTFTQLVTDFSFSLGSEEQIIP